MDKDISPTSPKETSGFKCVPHSCVPSSTLLSREIADMFSSSFSFDGFGILAWQLWYFRVWNTLFWTFMTFMVSAESVLLFWWACLNTGAGVCPCSFQYTSLFWTYRVLTTYSEGMSPLVLSIWCSKCLLTSTDSSPLQGPSWHELFCLCSWFVLFCTFFWTLPWIIFIYLFPY